MVKWFTVKRRDGILNLINELKAEYKSLTNLTPCDRDPIKMSGNYRVLVFRSSWGVMVKVEGPSEVIYLFQNILFKIKNGELSEDDYVAISKLTISK